MTCARSPATRSMWLRCRAVVACASALVICESQVTLGQGMAIPDSGVAVSRGLQGDLQALVALVQTMRRPTPSPNQASIEALIAAVD